MRQQKRIHLYKKHDLYQARPSLVVKGAPISCHQNTTLRAAFGCEGGSHVLPPRYHLVVMGSLAVFSPKGRGFVLLKGWLSLRVTQSTHGADKVKVLAR